MRSDKPPVSADQFLREKREGGGERGLEKVASVGVKVEKSPGDLL